MRETFEATPHAELSPSQVAAIRRLFDTEYLTEHGPWDPREPYGYSPADVHVLAYLDSVLVGHAGFQLRTITVGGEDVEVAGTGGVLVDASTRGKGLGRRVMLRTQRAMQGDERVDFGYLGCREQIVPFYESVGWQRINATERHITVGDPQSTTETANSPILILPIRQRKWPPGAIDLLGTPW